MLCLDVDFFLLIPLGFSSFLMFGVTLHIVAQPVWDLPDVQGQLPSNVCQAYLVMQRLIA